ncbi:hypothetical protein PAECIP111802_03237 [Paenibacillus allorhizosphaerae]|uniref:DUF3955 domain-containing protein n=1 Tax=Paenibacillus allorhizosphaerae TaxID=2849866 RepID=A0ABN7TP53_9BACL|nr:hypothetical protein PAECIP111802_03237 [Paenibacillus allorhizosphaerae]
MVKKLAFLRILVGMVCISLGVYGYMWWNHLLNDSGGPDQGSGIMMVVPQFISIILVVIGFVFFGQGIIKICKRGVKDRSTT